MAGNGKEGKVPNWAQAPLEGFRVYGEQEQNLVMLSTRGIAQIARSVPLVQALERLAQSEEGSDQSEESPQSEAVAEAEKLAELAKAEAGSQFRLLHGHSIVGVWGALETMVTDLIAAWLLNIPQARQAPGIAEFKISVAEFEGLSSEDRMHAIVSDLDRKNIGRTGIDRFEGLLDSVLLSGSHASQIAKNLYEMQQIRNVFAHRRGIADRRFVEACPHLRVKLGEPVPLGHLAWADCLLTSVSYATTVFNRVRTYFKAPLLDAVEIEPIRFDSRLYAEGGAEVRSSG